MGTKRSTSFRLSARAKELLALLSDRMGLSRASMLELLIRERAKAEKVK